MFAEHLNGPRKLCGHPAPCLPANYPGFGAQSAPKTLTRSKWSNDAKSLSRLHSNKASVPPCNHSDRLLDAIISLYQHSYRHHV